MKTKLYFFAASTSDGDNLDMIVEAKDANKANQLFESYWIENEIQLNDIENLKIYIIKSLTDNEHVRGWLQVL